MVETSDNSELVDSFSNLDDLRLEPYPILDLHAMRTKVTSEKIEMLLNIASNKIKEIYHSLPRFNCHEWKDDGCSLEVWEIEVLENGDIYLGSWDINS